MQEENINNDIHNPILDNLEFQHKYEFDKSELNSEYLKFRMLLLNEEFSELQKAYFSNDSEEFIDALIDFQVIALGTLSIFGVDVNKAWSEVYRANMQKIRGVKPGRESSGGNDVYKPENWVGPNHSDNHGIFDDIFNK